MIQCKKILVLYVGGTIGMQKNQNGVYIPIPNTFLKKVKNSEMHDKLLCEKYGLPMDENELILQTIGEHTILYKIEEYSPLLDSSNMSTKEWIRIAQDIKKNYKLFDGFVVLHGTDTLAYTASALSFMLDNLQKSVIITGSQIPIFETRSDAKDNFLSSLIFASCYDIPEVCVFFANKLLRGNRTTKISSNLLDAFDSPNYHHLGETGIEVHVYEHYIRKNTRKGNIAVHTNINPNVGTLSFFPTITSTQLESFLKPPVDGVVLQSYGAGNIPSNKPELLRVLKEAVQRGVLIVNISQCARGTVSIAYETAQALEEIGIISGSDMTVEAALTKLSYILGSAGTYEDKVKLLKSDLRGELTNSNIK
ncbi:60 kDa lysophospholipase [Sitophilus oryzae]|uniref:asparaginase n=1 Tax=Sitophilus oryzae TaxID=7048 RepID=A0A6J2YHC0_SITOR|nr:60 kDa lysophospholipase [Sitophilus oryzae]